MIFQPWASIKSND